MEKQIKETIAQVFDEISAGLAHGSFARRTRVGFTLTGSEHGEEEMRRGVALVQSPELEVVVIEEADPGEAQTRMDAMLDSGEIDAAVTMHYSFPIGVSTIGRVVTPGMGRMMHIASTTGTSDTERVSAMIKNTISAIAVAKACGNPAPTVGILNLDGARQVERALQKLAEKGYPICFTQSARADGGVVMRGNDLLQGVPDIMVMDSLTGNVTMKVMSAYTSGGNYESLGDGYGPGVGEGYKRIVNIISRASGAPVVAGALRYAGACARGKLVEKSKEEFASARKAGLDAILDGLAQAGTAQQGSAAKEVKQPPEKVVNEEITGVEILVLEDAVRVVWEKGIYATSGMGCTGPVIMVAEEDAESAVAALKAAEYL